MRVSTKLAAAAVSLGVLAGGAFALSGASASTTQASGNPGFLNALPEGASFDTSGDLVLPPTEQVSVNNAAALGVPGSAPSVSVSGGSAAWTVTLSNGNTVSDTSGTWTAGGSGTLATPASGTPGTYSYAVAQAEDGTAPSVTSADLISGTGSVDAVITAISYGSDDWTASAPAASGSITPDAAEYATEGEAYSLQMAAPSSFTPAFDWTATGLPSGLSIGSSTGLISGTPDETGTYTVTVNVTGDGGSQTVGPDVFALVVSTRGHHGSNGQTGVPVTSGTVTIYNPGTRYAVLSEDYADFVHADATDSAGNTLAYSASGLPGGMSVDTASGEISGTPDADGTFDVTLTATDESNNDSASVSFDIVVRSTRTRPARGIDRSSSPEGAIANQDTGKCLDTRGDEFSTSLAELQEWACGATWDGIPGFDQHFRFVYDSRSKTGALEAVNPDGGSFYVAEDGAGNPVVASSTRSAATKVTRTGDEYEFTDGLVLCPETTVTQNGTRVIAAAAGTCSAPDWTLPE